MKIRNWFAGLLAAFAITLTSLAGAPAMAQDGPSAAAVTAAEEAYKAPDEVMRERAVGFAAGKAQEAIDEGKDPGEAAAAAIDAIYSPFLYSGFMWTTLLFLIGGFLVMWMAAGFAMLEAGLVRSKNVAMQCTKNILLFSTAGVAYYLIGYNLMYPLGNWMMEGYLSGRLGPGRA